MNKLQLTMSVVIIIMITIGGVLSTIHSVSALTDVQRYNEGYTAGNTGDLRGLDQKLRSLGDPTFLTHTMAYQNGYIAGLDAVEGLKIPYYDYTTHGTVNIPGEAFQSFAYISH